MVDTGADFLGATLGAGVAADTVGFAEGGAAGTAPVTGCVADADADSSLELGSGAVCEQAPREMPKTTAHA